MFPSEIEFERLAHSMIERHGLDAAKAAVARLNETIDRGDLAGRERWACVVRAIHECQSIGPAFSRSGGSADAARLAPAHP
jgi:hypothetical protein